MDAENIQEFDTLIDLWESDGSSGSRMTVNEFLKLHAAHLDASQLEKLRGKLQALLSIDQLLLQNEPTKPSVEHPVSSNSGNPFVDLLQPRNEPIDGYTLLYRIGMGGHGEVWKAVGPGGFEVALKFVALEGRGFATESRALELIRRVRHQYLLAVLGSWVKNGWLIIAFELADFSLFDRLQDAVAQGQQGIPFEELIRYMRQIAQVLDFLNQLRVPELGVTGIQHRDVKPQNILVIGDIAKLGDLGISRTMKGDDTGHTGALTIHYAAPEFFSGKTSRFSDQYSLAITYVQLRTGKLPFTGSDYEVLKGHVANRPDLSLLPFDERAAVQRALLKRPIDRWPSCSDFISAIEAPPARDSWGRWRNNLLGTLGRREVRSWVLLCVVSLVLILAGLSWVSGPGRWFDRALQLPPLVTFCDKLETSRYALTHWDYPNNDRVLRGLVIWPGSYGENFRFTAFVGIEGIYATTSGPELFELANYDRNEGPTVIMAEPGYVVGSMRIRKKDSDRWSGLMVRFVRVRENRMDADDTYSVNIHLREQFSVEKWLGNNRQPFVGLGAVKIAQLHDFAGCYRGELIPSEILPYIEDNGAFYQVFKERSYQITSNNYVRSSSSRDQSWPSVNELNASAVRDDFSRHNGLPPSTSNSLGMRFRLIPPGELSLPLNTNNPQAGKFDENLERRFSPPPENLDNRDEVHALLIEDWLPGPCRVDRPTAPLINERGFYLSESEVTLGTFREYRRLVEQEVDLPGEWFTITEKRKEFPGLGYNAEKRSMKYEVGTDWRAPGFPQADDHPVTNISYVDAERFCRWLSAREGKVYRLPTDQEWQYACRAGSSASFSWGNEESKTTAQMNCGDKSLAPFWYHHSAATSRAEDGYAFTSPVAAFPPNRWGLLGMHGNIWEWCSGPSPQRLDGTYLKFNYYLRGGSYLRSPEQCGSDYRLQAFRTFSSSEVGFRVLLEIDEILDDEPLNESNNELDPVERPAR